MMQFRYVTLNKYKNLKQRFRAFCDQSVEINRSIQLINLFLTIIEIPVRKIEMINVT